MPLPVRRRNTRRIWERPGRRLGPRRPGAGFCARPGCLWTNHAEGHIEDIEIALPDNPNWQSFKFRLTGVETMDRASWERFQREKIQPPAK